jgi:hypothetical protein
MESLMIQEYSEKTFVVRGDTRPYKETLKKLGGKWNSRLSEKNSNDKFGAWLYFNSKRSDVDKWFLEGCCSIETEISTPSSNNLIRIEAKLDKILEILCKTNVELPEDLMDEMEMTKPKKRLL